MPDWVMPALLQAGFAGVLLFVLWKDGKRNTERDERIQKREESNQGFLRDMIVRAEAQQREVTVAFRQLLAGQQETNTALAAEVKALVTQGREVANEQNLALERMCNRLLSHEVQSAQRDEVKMSQLQTLIKEHPR